jgi:hypothetical protein
MSYCFGFEKECVLNDFENTTTIQSSITACSDINPLSSFDPAQAIPEATGESDGIDEIGWPSYLTDDFIALAPTSQTMAMLFILGTCAVGISIFLRLSTVRYIWQPTKPHGIDPPPSYPESPSLSGISPSKLQLATLIVWIIPSKSVPCLTC